jgi:hypothetical protein
MMSPGTTGSGGQDHQQTGAKSQLYRHIRGDIHSGIYRILNRGRDKGTTHTEETAGEASAHARC